MMELADIRAGQIVLDVATGIGEPAVTAARRVGPLGHVIATDLSTEMLALGRKRVAELDLQNIDFREMDAEALYLPEKSFDVILSRLGLMFLPNLPEALARMRKLLLPGGRLVAAVWGAPQRVPFARIPMEVAMKELQLPPPAPGLPGVFSLSNAEHVERLLTAADFAQVQIEPTMLTVEMASAEEYVRFQQLFWHHSMRCCQGIQPSSKQRSGRPFWKRPGNILCPMAHSGRRTNCSSQAGEEKVSPPVFTQRGVNPLLKRRTTHVYRREQGAISSSDE